MFIENLQLKNYRNYNDLDLSFDRQINIFQGNNAQGKTNILEALYLLALAKSHRTSKEKELIRWGNSFSVVKGSFKTRRGNLNLEVQLTPKGKKVKVNQLEKRKLSEYIGMLNVVMFGPEDLSLVKGSPQYRRKFLDIEIGQVSPSYLYHLSQYQKVIRHRNNYLKEITNSGENSVELLEIWDIQLIEHGTKVILKRINFLRQLEKWAKNIHSNITDNREVLSILYKSSLSLEDGSLRESDIMEQYKNNLLKLRQQEIYRGTTLIGPHRDDLEFFINQVDVQSFGSQGQQRTTALSLKLAEIELINEEVGEYPILLLDDVLSELDAIRQTQLIQTIEDKVQTIITTTSIDSIDINTLKRSALYHVEAGKVKIGN
ncbi:DNA replication/repair protein RecF [Vulcanibacillus modesticaldus]|uniref:DNA replication and repair protein RecF n=1 Tax=Vulcanibacillus modesticaldus TaxID=337097 RepID=A0A1D2YVC8_9BACI|nr:DNA replication/repair protein RecF [Vulcanibacillus modesticaldus]OEF99631.1 DNA replication/repair protein RecF [Vulcanibacillus modesticaldus]